MSERAEATAGVEEVDCTGRTALVTGSTDGIGREIALALGRLGATVLVHGRDREKGRRVVDRIDGTRGDAALYVADFADQTAVRTLADDVVTHGPVDVLVNNAGGYFRRPRLTPQGFEYTFGVNHLAPFLLTSLLRPRLADGARVVTTASGAHRDADGIDFDAVRTVEGYDAWEAYARSKLANVCFAAALDRRLADAVSTAFHPGFVPGSAFPRELPLPIRAGMRAVASLPDVLSGLVANSVVEGAATGVYLAVSPELDDAGGAYFRDLGPVTPSAAARDRELQTELWEHSLGWTGVAGTGRDRSSP